jgi:Rps23 Pro-64 3,4-dihydroxylase Tpa1-like proline 4-hydroxylase
LINIDNLKQQFVNFQNNSPFPHCVIDNFFDEDIARQLANDFANYETDTYNGKYFNDIEVKKTCNIWDRFPETTYRAFQYLNSIDFMTLISTLTGAKVLYSDSGLHGGGWHIHPSGGKLNVHLDYSIHPKMKLQRKFNLIIYLNENYQTGWGGELGLWTNKDNKPHECVKVVEPLFNRAVIFDTTGWSWHGLEVPNKFPENECRKSMAVYYLQQPDESATDRNRALFAPSKEQMNDPEILQLIERRSQTYGQDPELWSRK